MLIRAVLDSAENNLEHVAKPTGSYLVEYCNFDLHDSDRPQVGHLQGRLVPIRVYFPTKKGEHKAYKKQLEHRSPKNDWKPLEAMVFSKQSDLSNLDSSEKRPLVILNHGDTVAMTDYSYIAEDLASHGYIVIAIQHQLQSEQKEPPYLKERSINRYANTIDNIFFVFMWLQNNLSKFQHSLDTNRVAMIGHSMGGNALLALLHRASDVFKQKKMHTILPHKEAGDVKEAFIVLDTGGFPYPSHAQYPLLLLLAGERENYQRERGTSMDMQKIGHQSIYYKGAKHISFMDHGYVNPVSDADTSGGYFDGTFAERMKFFDNVRKDLREFIRQKL